VALPNDKKACLIITTGRTDTLYYTLVPMNYTENIIIITIPSLAQQQTKQYNALIILRVLSLKIHVPL